MKTFGMDTSIKHRLIFSFSVVIVFIMLLLAGVIATQVSLSDEINSIYDSNRKIITLNENVRSLEEETEQYLSTNTTEALEKVHGTMNELNLITYEMKNAELTSQVNLKTRDIGFMTDRLMEYVNAAILAKMTSNTEAYTTNFKNISSLVRYIDTQCTSINNLLAEENIAAIQQHDKKQFSFYQFAALFILLVILECVLYITRSTRSITRPIIEMADHARKIAGGDFNVTDVTCDSHDEVATLTATFNQMRTQIRDNIQEMRIKQRLETELMETESENYRIELLLRDARLVAMQAQIQPHFLFNTINAGLQIAYSEGANVTVEYFSQMSDFLRYNLKNIWVPVSLRSEVEQIYRYFYIMQKRFGNNILFAVNEQIDDAEQRRILVPCMILQPLVENCYTHGIRMVDRRGEIRMILCRYRKHYAVRIVDNGVGMPETLAARLLSTESPPDVTDENGHRSIGVRNVLDRLRNYYRRDEVAEIHTKEGAGTEVILLLEEEKHEIAGC